MSPTEDGHDQNSSSARQGILLTLNQYGPLTELVNPYRKYFLMPLDRIMNHDYSRGAPRDTYYILLCIYTLCIYSYSIYLIVYKRYKHNNKQRNLFSFILFFGSFFSFFFSLSEKVKEVDIPKMRQNFLLYWRSLCLGPAQWRTERS